MLVIVFLGTQGHGEGSAVFLRESGKASQSTRAELLEGLRSITRWRRKEGRKGDSQRVMVAVGVGYK